MFQPNIALEQYLAYVPIRSAGNREQCFNQSFFIHNQEFLTNRYRVPPHQYKKMVQMYENAWLIEQSIDQGRPIAINALEHCRVCVGYNDTHLLFADSWTTNYSESNASGSDVNVAGFSVVDKWLVYVWMRDVVSVQERGDRPSSTKEQGGGAVIDLTAEATQQMWSNAKKANDDVVSLLSGEEEEGGEEGLE